MFDKSLFIYDEETHTGLYEGSVVPSITQLISVIYPMSEDISTQNLENASNRGTEIHKWIKKVNKVTVAYGKNNPAYNSNIKEVINYYRLTKAYHLVADSCEETVFLLDENGDLIAYGHYDQVLKVVEPTEGIFETKGEFIMSDNKTVSSYSDDKVKLQTEMYRTAYRQCFNDKISDRTCGIHIRDDIANIHIYNETRTDAEVIEFAKFMLKLWKEKQDER